ncbi:MAG: hypothetical protein AMJ69_03060 [Gammaproteobacteria bacterium SG8_47]|nr:MAG: hypothetical protein AMJ69_03060 [Gammaproteobacteria bacterium SG8_47]
MSKLVRSLAFVLAWCHLSMAQGSECEQLAAELDLRHARATAEAALALDPAQVQALTAIETELFAALKQCPHSAELYVLMGEVQVSLGQIPLASLYGRKAVALNPQSWRAQQFLGSVLAMLGEAEAGTAHLERAVSIVPDNDRVRLNLASALVAAKRYDEVIELCSRLIESPELAVAAGAHHLRGRAYLGQARVSEANRDFRAARELGWDPPRSLIDLSDWQSHLDETGDP